MMVEARDEEISQRRAMVDSESYKQSFKDSVEICLFEVRRAKALEEARKR